MLIYKYLDEAGIDMLERLRFRVTPPNRFNDPFEFTPLPPGEFPISRARQIIKDKEALRRLYTEFRLNEGYYGSFKDFRKRIRKEREKLASDFAKAATKSVADDCQNYLNEVSKQIGIVCFSKVPDSILMWAHYAQKHQGFVVGIEVSENVLDATNVFEVQYRDERVLGVLQPAENDPATWKSTIELVRTKSTHWKYEHEIRAVFLLNRMSPDRGDGYFYQGVIPALIKRIILGYRSNTDLQSKILSAISRNGINVQVERMHIHESKFELVARPVFHCRDR